jgi:hypothetical protein
MERPVLILQNCYTVIPIIDGCGMEYFCHVMTVDHPSLRWCISVNCALRAV